MTYPRVRHYSPEHPTALPRIVWLHGGGFVSGDLDMPEADGVARALAAAGCRVESVDYALLGGAAGANPLRDVLDVIDAGSEPYVLGGASAGAALALGAALTGASVGRSASGLVLAYPVLDSTVAPTAARGALKEETLVQMLDLYSKSLDDPALARPLILSDDRLATLPPTLCVSAAFDSARASANLLEGRMRALDLRVRFVQADAEHGFLNDAERRRYWFAALVVEWLDGLGEITSRGSGPEPLGSN